MASCEVRRGLVGEMGAGMGGAICCTWRRTHTSVFGEFGIKLGCTFGGVHGDCNGDMIPSRFWGPVVSHVVVEVPPGGCQLQRGVHWLHCQPCKIHHRGHQILRGQRCIVVKT